MPLDCRAPLVASTLALLRGKSTRRLTRRSGGVFLLGVFVALALLVLSRAARANPLRPDLEHPSFWATTDLAGPFRFRVGDDPRWSSPDLDDGDWQELALPEKFGWLRGRARGEFAWYRRRVGVPETAVGPEVGISFGLVNGAYEAFVNGERVGACGEVEPVLRGAPPLTSCSFAVPRSALSGRDSALIALRVRQSHTDGLGAPFALRRMGDGVYRLGPLAQVRELAAADTSASQLRLSMPSLSWIVLSLLVALPSFWLYRLRRELRAYLLFGVVMSLFALGNAASLAVVIEVVGYTLSTATQAASGWIAGALLWEFFLELLLARRPGRFVRVLQALCVVLAVLSFIPAFNLQATAFGASAIAFLVQLPCALWLVAREALAGNRTARLIGMGVLSFTLVFGGVMLLALGDHARLRTMSFAPPMIGFALFTGSILLLLMDQFARKLFEVEESRREIAARERETRALNEELQRQIARRSQQLSEVLGRLGALPGREARLVPGQLVDGRYRVVRPLGAGGMGAVYEVVNERSGERFALKVLLSARDGAALARFAREAQVAASVRHPNLVAVSDVDVSADGALYIVMEFVLGRSLDAHVGSFGNVSWARPILRQIAEGLAALHAAGVTHRDLKPANVMLTEQGVAKLADFGIAGIQQDEGAFQAAAPGASQLAGVDPRAPTETPDVDPALAPTMQKTPRLTGEGAFVGTPLYMAPEHAQGSSSAGAAADIWSFGVLAVELSTCALPFDIVPVFHALARTPWPTPRLPDDPALATLLARCLSIDANDRPTAADVARALGGSPLTPRSTPVDDSRPA